MPTPAESVLQFGSGRFLRAFADLFIHEARQAGQNIGRVVVVQSTGVGRAQMFNEQGGRYRVRVRGIRDGRRIDESIQVESVSRALSAGEDWEAVLAVGRDPSTEYILSNTSEIGYDVQESERLDGSPPDSFPGKLLGVLLDRYENGGAPVTVIPCELIDGNAGALRRLMRILARKRRLGDGFLEWMEGQVTWLHTLVDRITIEPPPGFPNPHGDGLLALTEPFAFWALEDRPDAAPFIEHPAVVRTKDVRPYALRKVRVLNGAHTALVCRAMPLGIRTVREAVDHAETGPWLRDLMLEEIVPALPDAVEDARSFAAACIERFRNPFLDHRLESIAVEHETKVRLRLVPTFEAYVEKFQRKPPLLSVLLD
ncbi:MAG: altronate dehydrogenase [Gemmatimonadetes bacterium]|nr:altronate dehydrogenase [Gemmatimonadota bacterium]